MTYGANKVKDLGRSVLPARGRKNWRTDLVKIKRKNRHNVSQALRMIDSEEAAWDIEDDLNEYPNHKIGSVVYERRLSDNLGAIYRWAAYTAKAYDTPQERRDAVKRILPDNLQGRHAFSHIENTDAYELDYPHEHAYFRAYLARKEHDAFIDACRYAQLADDLYKILSTAGAHARFNRFFKKAWSSRHSVTGAVDWSVVTEHSSEVFDFTWRTSGKNIYTTAQCKICSKPRVLLGIDDIDGFIADYLNRRSRFSVVSVAPVYIGGERRPVTTKALFSYADHLEIKRWNVKDFFNDAIAYALAT